MLLHTDRVFQCSVLLSFLLKMFFLLNASGFSITSKLGTTEFAKIERIDAQIDSGKFERFHVSI